MTNQPDNDRSQPDKEAAIMAPRSARDSVLAVVRRPENAVASALWASPL
jgi:hypothetical protein